MKTFIDNVIDKILSLFVKILGIALLITVVLQIISRYLPISMVWTDELSRLLFVWFSMLSVAVACIENKHLYLDILYTKLKPKLQRTCDILSDILVLCTAVLISVEGFKLLSIVSMQTSPVLQVSMVWFYASVPVGFVFVAGHTTLKLLNALRSSSRSEAPHSKEEE